MTTLTADRAETRREQQREYWRRTSRAKAYGIWQAPLVDAAPATKRVRELRDLGYGASTISEGTGVAGAVISGLVATPGARAYRSQVRREFADAILHVTETQLLDRAGDTSNVPAVGTIRRLEGLGFMGWTIEAVADHVGVRKEQMKHLRGGSLTVVSALSYRRVKAAYDDLSLKDGGNAKAREAARIRGWAPPLAWDDATIDDPTAEPDFGTPTGRPGGQLADFDTLDDLANMGCTLAEAADRVGLQRDSITQAARRHGGPWVVLLRRFENNAITRGIYEPAGKAAA